MNGFTYLKKTHSLSIVTSMIPTACALIQSIQLLKEGTSKFALGEFNSSVDISSHDELEILGENFNKMSNQLQENIRRIIEINKI